MFYYDQNKVYCSVKIYVKRKDQKAQETFCVVQQLNDSVFIINQWSMSSRSSD